MTKRLLLAALVLFAPWFAYADGGCVHDMALQQRATGLAVIPGAQVRVCTDLSCNTLATIYSDAALLTLTANPVLADTRGNYSFCAAGTFTVKVTNPADGTFYHQFNVTAAGGTGTSSTVYVGDANGHGRQCSMVYSGGGFQSTNCIYTPLYWILSTGQSLSVGALGSPKLSTTQPYNNLMLTSGVEGSTAAFLPLTENGTGTGGDVETPSAGMANYLAAATNPTNYRFGVGLHGVGGIPYIGLKKGTAPYTKGLLQVTNANSLTPTPNYAYMPIAITNTHGESDYGFGCTAPCNSYAYESYLNQWQSDYLADVSASFPNVSRLPMFISQMNSGWTGEMAQAQWQAHKDYPGRIIMVGPKYQFAYGADHLHMTNTDYKWLGEYYGKVIKKVMLDGTTWNPLQMSGATLASNVITASFNIPSGTLALDTANVASRTNYGFEFYQSGGTARTISSVALANSNTQVAVTLSGPPNGANQQLRYAWTCPVGTTWCGGAADSTKVGGNVRDTDSSVSPSSAGTGKPLYDWLVAGYVPLPSVPEPPYTITATNITNTTVQVSCNSNGISGYPLTVLTATSSPGAITGTASACPVPLSGLTPAGTYTFTVTATNAYGTSASSAASAAITMDTVPTPLAYYLHNGDYIDATGNNPAATAGGTGNSFITDPIGAHVHGTVLSLNGSGYVSTGIDIPASHSQTMWVYLATASACRAAQICNLYSTGSGGGSVMLLTYGGSPFVFALRAGDQSSGAVVFYAQDPSAFPLDQWVHIAQTYDAASGAYKLYINGTQVATGTKAGTSYSPSGLIGAYNGANRFDGYIGKVRLYNYALTATDVANIAAIN